MRLARFAAEGGYQIFAARDGGWVPLSGVQGMLMTDLLEETHRTKIADQIGAARASGRTLEDAATVLDSGDIWGAGLNYRGHSADLNTEQPASGPGSYLRPRGCLIGNGQQISLPSQSKRVTAEAELGLIVGRACKNVRRDEWRSVIAGVTAVLDMTAEDVIRENPRYIPWAKGFDTFCSVGPQLVTLDEFDDAALQAIRVSTVRNGQVVATAAVSEMKYDLGYLVEYFTAGRTLAAGTVICTGTPGAAVIAPGDVIKAVVDGVGTLSHTVA
ncbi:MULTISPECIES: fumarylacetoacetate hydrolase family protein [Micromonospora]|uniref:FAA hydrolase family protein n=1 Tax=Micromonospora solifontis TaxID=2487138 RepID=A0ABX9WHK8_9ACTN|nr:MULTISPECIES: fumarylacetoacetate hydrolase family protein [Micromonospora]NES16752.1 fumarylacetoacetate hydrolase family protein [Micromonospora sp. PPF5-17B]NES37757.1 fumarylacetoacetate hydrolase family protein [Micromonospora solifontis]NES58821.1 fumarylacetoacetate hydrolase family protein [Micromonospora sp. PPF5-6]RNL98021.1 FAA hydrolase family protein [Micromonospora solifontis]